MFDPGNNLFLGGKPMSRYIPVFLIALAGLVHLLIAPVHYAHAPAHGLFFAGAGLGQCVWAVAFWRRPSLALYRVGLAASGGLVVLWLLTLALPVPFGGHAEPIDASVIVCKASELIGLVSLVILALVGQTTFGPRSTARRVGEALALSVIVGLVFFGVGKAAEPMFPGLGHEAQHAHEHSAEAPDHAEEHNQDHDQEEHDQ
jgi:hypothetical protein